MSTTCAQVMGLDKSMHGEQATTGFDDEEYQEPSSHMKPRPAVRNGATDIMVNATFAP